MVLKFIKTIVQSDTYWLDQIYLAIFRINLLHGRVDVAWSRFFRKRNIEFFLKKKRNTLSEYDESRTITSILLSFTDTID